MIKPLTMEKICQSARVLCVRRNTHTRSGVPNTKTSGLLVGLVPERGDSNECRRNSAFSQAKEEPLGDETVIVVTDDREDADNTPDEHEHAGSLGKRKPSKEQSHRQNRNDVSPIELLSAMGSIPSAKTHSCCRGRVALGAGHAVHGANQVEIFENPEHGGIAQHSFVIVLIVRTLQS